MASTFDTQFATSAAPELMASFGETVSYTAAGAEAKNITGIFSEDADAMAYQDDERGVLRVGVLKIYTDTTLGIASPAEGDAVSIRGETWYVQGKPSTATMHTLAIVLYARQEVAGGKKFVRRS